MEQLDPALLGQLIQHARPLAAAATRFRGAVEIARCIRNEPAMRITPV